MTVDDKGWVWIFGAHQALGEFCCQVKVGDDKIKGVFPDRVELASELTAPTATSITARRITQFRVVPEIDRATKKPTGNDILMPMPWVVKRFEIVDDQSECPFNPSLIMWLFPPPDRLIEDVLKVWIKQRVTPADQKMQDAEQAAWRAAQRMRGGAEMAKKLIERARQ